MIYKEFGDKDLPTLLFLHGGGLSWWSFQTIIKKLENSYHIILPIIDGHGEAGDETFSSIENYAQKVIDYIDHHHNGTVYAISGLSLGAQIVVEILSQRENIATYAVIESALVIPIKVMKTVTIPLYQLFFRFIQKKGFAKLQSKSLFVPEEMFEQYYEDSLKMSKQSLIQISLSNMSYELKETIKKTKTSVLIIVGAKELKIMRKSADLLYRTIPNSELYIADGLRHGELSLIYYDQYIRLIKHFFAQKGVCDGNIR